MWKIKVAKWHGFFNTLHTIRKTQEYIWITCIEKNLLFGTLFHWIFQIMFSKAQMIVFISLYIYIYNNLYSFISNLYSFNFKNILLMLYLCLVLVIAEDEESDQFLCHLACYIATETFQHWTFYWLLFLCHLSGLAFFQIMLLSQWTWLSWYKSFQSG